MPAPELTAEQKAIIEHPLGEHARVLAVAGSGKTSTMVERVIDLVTRRGVNPGSILVLMFNALARKQFKERLDANADRIPRPPEVHSFHSYSYGLVQEAISSGRLSAMEVWAEDKRERVVALVRAAMTNLVAAGRIGKDSVDAEEALDAIGLWKGALKLARAHPVVGCGAG